MRCWFFFAATVVVVVVVVVIALLSVFRLVFSSFTFPPQAFLHSLGFVITGCAGSFLFAVLLLRGWLVATPVLESRQNPIVAVEAWQHGRLVNMSHGCRPYYGLQIT